MTLPETKSNGGLAVIGASVASMAVGASLVSNIWGVGGPLPIGANATASVPVMIAGAVIVTVGSVGILAGLLEVFHSENSTESDDLVNEGGQ